ncbi:MULTISPECIES: ATP phosphoribosyltransferase regulatory subunit [Thiorhodovibrio]|uniref:ATP phosphoribosyltransferase regulatory subunit n=1 Tax=Thiorhodovibrio TaxID=61593 RepID=UPI001912CD9B|nr:MULTISPECIES: ATP phosphoribosyltransferase regulatory subunit [Thiorhodovibrio]MBK5969556.1 ATP phosphoribosyltransferase regulatory subunit [Thiorhodovibrio winogradskyi]WPL13945.1 ATP phosphoribosyltransferase regulatory subunit [Thiorhodovibrio litoralis]
MKLNQERWLLPTGIEEILPPQAREMERLRRCLLDLFDAWGYDLVIPPFIDYLESLLTGTGRDLDLQTFKLTDQLSGRLLGVRADMTPQVARIDAHQLRREGPTRLCYLGTVLHTRSDGFAGTRSPMQIGADIYGHAGAESDVEILRLLLMTLQTAGIDSAYLDLGHVGIFRGLAEQAGFSREQELALFGILQRKASTELTALLEESGVEPAVADMLLALVELNGDDALERAGRLLGPARDGVHQALENLRLIASELRAWLPDVPVHFDLGELRGYTYKTGVVFAAFVPGWGLEIARGGRYDAIGEFFGHARPAVGFSTDLKGLIGLALARAGSAASETVTGAVLAPNERDPELRARVEELRASGRRVLNWLPGQQGRPDDLGVTHQLERRDGRWELVPVSPGER